MSEEEPLIVSIDPGSEKCGLAVITEAGAVRQLTIVATSELAEVVGRWVAETPVAQIIVGNRTGSRSVIERLAALGSAVPVTPVPEHNSTLMARDLYFEDHPPRGWRRLIPRGMQVPPVPVDDYAALAIAHAWQARDRRTAG